MYAEDLQADGHTRNRLQTVKPIIEAFINRRPDDRIGVVVFAGRAYTFAPLTMDHDWLRRQTARLAIGAVEDGTAIGDALGVSLARLQQGARHKEATRLGAFIVLLTDGASNRGALDPRQAAGLVAEQGVAVYAIGAGAEGLVPMPVFDFKGKRTGTEFQRSEIDDLLLRDIAEKTNGLYFRATDAHAIEASFAEIDRMTRSEFAAPPLRVTRELFVWFIATGVACLALAAIGVTTRAQREEAFA
jgi:Ca-activated chloride channel family protein